MITNPYAPPSGPCREPNGQEDARDQALFQFQIGLSVLLLAAFFNLFHFSQMVRSNARISLALDLALLGNAIGLMVASVVAWRYGFWALERLAWLIHRMLRRDVSLPLWNRVFYDSFPWVPHLSLVGGLLWVVWVLVYYMTSIDFYAISIPIGAAAHVVGAAWYLPLFYRWSRLSSNVKTREADLSEAQREDN